MADNVSITEGSGVSIAADEIASVKYQRVKLSLGADGTAVDAGAGAGAVGTDTQRVTLGSDDPAVTSLAIIDDWDESDRAKVNPIVGQAGVAAGAGAVGATVQRVTLASDDPAVVSAQLIDDAIVADDAAFTPATTKVMMAGFEYDDTTPDSVDEGDAGAARMSARREVYTQIRDAAGNERGANVNASGQLSVTGPVTNAGTFAVQVDGNALTSLQLIDDTIIADDAAFTVGTTKVSAAGFLADETATDSVDEGDIGAARMTLDRKQHVVAELESASMRASGTSVTPKFAAIAAATSGDNTLVAAVTSKKIRVLAMCIVAGAAGNIYFTSAASGTVIFGGSTNKINLPANGGFVLPFNPAGWFENSSTNQALVMNASSTGPFSGGLVYIEV